MKEDLAIFWVCWVIFVVVLNTFAFVWGEKQRRKEFDETFGLPKGWRRRSEKMPSKALWFGKMTRCIKQYWSAGI